MRLRMKVWTNDSGTRFLMPAATLSFNSEGGIRGVTAWAMTDEDTMYVLLTVEEWNALPFFFFNEDGEAPKPTTRAPELVRIQ